MKLSSFISVPQSEGLTLLLIGLYSVTNPYFFGLLLWSLFAFMTSLILFWFTYSINVILLKTIICLGVQYFMWYSFVSKGSVLFIVWIKYFDTWFAKENKFKSAGSLTISKTSQNKHINLMLSGQYRHKKIINNQSFMKKTIKSIPGTSSPMRSSRKYLPNTQHKSLRFLQTKPVNLIIFITAAFRILSKNTKKINLPKIN